MRKPTTTTDNQNLTPEMVCARLRELEPEAELLLVVESGSRAWGFPAVDSDFDIRFIFAWKNRDAYLSLHDSTMTINRVQDTMDYAGWDIRKALRLAEKANPSLIEWLVSPVIYYEHHRFCRRLRGIMEEHFSPRALAAHYIKLIASSGVDYDPCDEPTLKSYLYAMRGILGIRWLRERECLPPVDIQTLVRETSPLPVSVYRDLEELVRVRRTATELATGRFCALDKFIAEFPRGIRLDDFPVSNVPIEPLNALYRQMVRGGG